MSDREKKLLIFFAVAGFAIINVLAFNFASGFRAKVDAERTTAEGQLQVAELAHTQREEVLDEMDWLAENEPEPIAPQDAQTKLQEFAYKEAVGAGLTVKTQKPLPTDGAAGKVYHRAKLQFVVSGEEKALYRWFERLNVPTEFRAVTQILLSPNKQDDTKIDCTATVEQWFLPPTT